MTDDGFYPDADWPIFPEVRHCAKAKKKVDHEPHRWIPASVRDEVGYPDVWCGGWPRVIVDMMEKLWEKGD